MRGVWGHGCVNSYLRCSTFAFPGADMILFLQHIGSAPETLTRLAPTMVRPCPVSGQGFVTTHSLTIFTQMQNAGGARPASRMTSTKGTSRQSLSLVVGSHRFPSWRRTSCLHTGVGIRVGTPFSMT